MRHLIVVVLAGVLLMPAAAAAQQQKPRKVRITDVRVGFKSGYDPGEQVDAKWQYLFKAGQWTPVYVDIEAGDEGLSRAELIVETTDSDDVQNNYVIPVPALQPKESATLTTYTKPGGTGSELIVTVRNEREQDQFKKMYEAVELHDVIFLAAGSHLTGLKQSLLNEVKEAERNLQQNAVGQGMMNRGRVSYADAVGVLPTRWYAYGPVDLMILSTSKTDFVNELINPGEKVRQTALAEWVRRGGRLVIAAGRNHDLARALLQALQMPALPVEIVPGGMQLPRLQIVWAGSGGGAQGRAMELAPKPGAKGSATIEVAKLRVKPGQEADVLILGPKPENPLMVRVPYGMGQVTLAAFDMDTPPFTAWEGQSDFWNKLRTKLGAALPRNADNANRGGFNAYGGREENDLAGLLRNSLEVFPEVSNISFGWVALFIFIYILVVGPLDYFFLKKVVKRLELTWITFPSVVLIVSTVSYFTAYALKGNDLLINKADLVDIDVTGQSAYGHTWFTLFSPRIQHYTIGVEPAAPVWSAEPADDKKASGVTVSWMGRPDTGFGGLGRARSQSLFRRAYNYAADATGLEGVPIQVWSMKSFAASWERPLDPAKPLFTADLRLSKRVTPLRGTITNHLPVPLEDVYLIYGGAEAERKVYELKKPLPPNEAVKLDLEDVHPSGIAEWPGALPTNRNNVNRNAPTAAVNKDDIFRRLIFHESFPASTTARNVTMRHLDESWRLRLRHEVILFGRVASQSAPAETVTQSPGTPTRLWLGKLPAPNVKRPDLQGTIAQDTYVRVFLPVKDEADANP